jgi:hypothetical protein
MGQAVRELWYEFGTSLRKRRAAKLGRCGLRPVQNRLFAATGRLIAVADDATTLGPNFSVAEHYWQGGQGTEPYKQNTQPQVSRLTDRI